MNPFKLKRLKKLAEQIVSYNKPLAQELNSLIYAAENKPHPGRLVLESGLSGAVKKIKDALGDITFCLIGGLAVQYWVEIRKTDDVDLVVLGDDLNRLKQIFPGGRDILHGYSFRLDGVNVDVMSSTEFAWAQEAIEKAREYDFLGTRIKVALPEYLILFKLVPMRDRDVSDIIALLALNGVPNKAMDLVMKYSPTEMEDLDQMIKMAELGQV